MRSVTYSMGVSLDGYIAGPDGEFDWTAPDEEVMRLVIDESRHVGVQLMGRGCRDDAVLGDGRAGFGARRIRARMDRDVEAAPEDGVLDHAVGGAGHCSAGLRRPGGGDRAVASRAGGGRHRDRRRDPRRRGGRIGPHHEYRSRVYPMLVGGGVPYFPHRERPEDLELVETRTFSSRVVYLRYRVVK